MSIFYIFILFFPMYQWVILEIGPLQHHHHFSKVEDNTCLELPL